MDLFFDGVATDNTHDIEPHWFGEPLGFVLDLLGQFSGRGKDYGVGAVVSTEIVDRGEGFDVDEDGDDKCRCFTRSSFGDTDDVAAFETDGDGLSLNRSRFLVSYLTYDFQ